MLYQLGRTAEAVAGLEEAVASASLGRILTCARGELEEAREDLRLMREIGNPYFLASARAYGQGRWRCEAGQSGWTPAGRTCIGC